MASTPAIAPVLGPDGERCPQCGEPLRSDQRYCLNCGRRRAPMRLPFAEIVGPHGPRDAAPAAVPVQPPGSAPSPLVALGLLLALLLALGIGVLIGRGARGPEVAAKAPVVNVSAAPAAATTTAIAAFVGDWPAGKDDWTIQLRTLPSTATAAEVAQAKQDATAAGAAAVGALRSDDFAALPAGVFVVYSGAFASKASARKALGSLRSSFPEATVVHVSTTAPAAAAAPPPPPAEAIPKKGSGLSPQEYQKKSKKLPDEVQSEGTAPPEDDKAPGGGSEEATEIG